MALLQKIKLMKPDGTFANSIGMISCVHLEKGPMKTFGKGRSLDE